MTPSTRRLVTTPGNTDFGSIYEKIVRMNRNSYNELRTTYWPFYGQLGVAFCEAKTESELLPGGRNEPETMRHRAQRLLSVNLNFCICFVPNFILLSELEPV